MDKIMDKLLTTGIAFGGGFVATKVFETVWMKVTGDENTPHGDDDENISLQKALVFSVTSAAISAGVQVLSQRGAKSAVRKLKGDKAEV